MGVILYELIYKKHPYTQGLKLTYPTIIIKVAERIMENNIKYPECKYSREFVDLVKKMLVIDVEERYNWE